MKNPIFFILILFITTAAFAQTEQVPVVKYYGLDYFLIDGTKIPLSDKESPYDRLPLSYKDKVRVPVWNLSKNSAGITVRFLTNSSKIKVKWSVLNDNIMNHMAPSGIKGVDLYFKNRGQWQYVNTGRPTAVDNEALLVENMTERMREYKLHLPLYDGVVSLEIGVDENSLMVKPEPSTEKPIVFYGTSITQGGCASRPGMVHTSIISRALDVEVINFGFSGNGKMETELVELISDIDAAFYVIDCLPNMTAKQVDERTIPLVDLIRTKHPDTPIILVENLIYENAFLDSNYKLEIEEKNQTLENQYNELRYRGDENVMYIKNDDAMGGSHEGTVDGVHLTDLGFQLFADYLIEKFKNFGLINLKVGKL